jgi:ADP-heptose:LPS heptosyltransferase
MGLGDVVQFARFVPEARRRVRRLVFLADTDWRTLAPLVATLQGVDDLCTDATALAALAERPIARASVHSLPYLLGVRVETLPGPVPYLWPLAERQAAWKARLEAIPRPRIGLAWSTQTRSRHAGYLTRQKTVPLSLLAPVIAAARGSFVSLQVGGADKLEPGGELGARMVDLTADIRDFGDTAAIISELDLVISTDTSVVHVAGAMGKPTWMLDRFNTCWRWRLAEDRSPWYPTMRIFRQQRFGDWQEPIARVAAALRQELH